MSHCIQIQNNKGYHGSCWSSRLWDFDFKDMCNMAASPAHRLPALFSPTVFAFHVRYSLIFCSLNFRQRLIQYKECVSFVFFVLRVSSLAANRLLPQTARFWDSLHCWRHHRLLHGGHRHQRSPVDAARQDRYRPGRLFCAHTPLIVTVTPLPLHAVPL